MNERLTLLEEKIAFLEHHVTAQDKAMLELAENISRLTRELKILRERSAGAMSGEENSAPNEERPPHY